MALAAPAHGQDLTIAELMRLVVNPAAETFWGGSGSVETEGGSQSRAPADDKRWAAIIAAAATVQESGALLTLPGRARDEVWNGYARDLASAGAAARKAAEARDEDAMLRVGGDIFDACRGCHVRYALGRG
jgi:hypothetical protein